eukprot:8547471-Karenia_brevis.AAC.1
MGADGVGVFVPQNDWKHTEGTWRHLRAACDKILRAELTRPSPKSWQSVASSDLVDAEGRSLERLPLPLRLHMSFTSISFRDPFLDAK